MERIHAVCADGTVLQNVAVFRYVYNVLGMGWVYGITKIPVIGKIVDAVYGVWAKYRLKVTGRPDLITLIQEREARLSCGVGKRCQV
jgi:predicted DCC family thiol-disulfide oxidoreductase YuxK